MRSLAVCGSVLALLAAPATASASSARATLGVSVSRLLAGILRPDVAGRSREQLVRPALSACGPALNLRAFGLTGEAAGPLGVALL